MAAMYFEQGRQGPEPREIFEHISSLVTAKVIEVGNDGNMPEDGEGARLYDPELPPHLGHIALQRPQAEPLAA